MSSFIYDLALQGFLTGSFDMATATVKIALVQITGSGTPYTANQATDQVFSIIPSGAVASTSPQLTSPVVTNGIFGAANTTFSSVTFGNACGALVMYIDTGTPSTSPLIAYLDSSDYSGLPITPNGGNINVSFPTGANLIFSL
jgi:hypothetical protein